MAAAGFTSLCRGPAGGLEEGVARVGLDGDLGPRMKQGPDEADPGKGHVCAVERYTRVVRHAPCPFEAAA